MSAFLQFLDRRTRAVLAVLTLLFLGVETFYAIHRPLHLDEFNIAWEVSRLATKVPFVDYQPFKPILGSCVLLALLHLGPDTWGGFVFARLGMTCLSAGVLFAGALSLRRLFLPGAVCFAYALMIVMTSLVEWAIEVRLDMLTALFGFVSLLLLLNRRIAMAGAVAGLGFLISQKGTMYALAGGIALLGCLATERDRPRTRDVLVYGACLVLPIGLYVLWWSLIASLPQVCRTTFAEPNQLVALTTPTGSSLYRDSWLETLERNPFFYLCSLWALGRLIALGRERDSRQTLLLLYGGTVVVMMLSLAQPWPYSFVLFVPTLLVLQADLFSRELRRPRSLLHRSDFLLGYCLFGLLIPLSRVPIVAQYDPGAQRQTIELTEALLGPEDRYFAGFFLLYRHDASARTLNYVDSTSAFPTHKLTTTEVAGILEHLRAEPIRLVVYNWKIDFEVPEPIRKHLYRNYAPLWANVWIYAPQVRPSDSDVNLLFTDVYSIEMEQPHPVIIDGQTYPPGATVELQRGRHTIATKSRLRLKLRAAKVDHLLNPAYREPTVFFWPGKGLAPPHARTGLWVDN